MFHQLLTDISKVIVDYFIHSKDDWTLKSCQTLAETLTTQSTQNNQSAGKKHNVY